MRALLAALTIIAAVSFAWPCDPGTCAEVQIVPQGESGKWFWEQATGGDIIDIDDVSIATSQTEGKVDLTTIVGSVPFEGDGGAQVVVTVRSYKRIGQVWVLDETLGSVTLGVLEQETYPLGDPLCSEPSPCASGQSGCGDEFAFCFSSSLYCASLGVCVEQIGECKTGSSGSCSCVANPYSPGGCPGQNMYWGPTQIPKCPPSTNKCVVAIDSNWLW